MRCNLVALVFWEHQEAFKSHILDEVDSSSGTFTIFEVLNKNKIKFEHNYPVSKRELGLDEPYSYFLDFFIENKKIDLEIDGKQHKDREGHDEYRDVNLIKNGFLVYRIKWKSINTEKGKIYIKNEIVRFLNFYNTVLEALR